MYVRGLAFVVGAATPAILTSGQSRCARIHVVSILLQNSFILVIIQCYHCAIPFSKWHMPCGAAGLRCPVERRAQLDSQPQASPTCKPSLPTIQHITEKSMPNHLGDVRVSR